MFQRPLRPRVRKSANQRTPASYTALEQRQMMAAFTGTAGDDLVTIQFTNGLPVSIDINGTLTANPGPTLDLDLLDGNDTLRLVGGSFLVNGSSTIRGTGSGGEDLFSGTGSVNNQVNYEFSGRLTIETGTGNDLFNISAAAGFLPNSSLPNPSFSIDSGSGNDTATISGGLGFIRLGAGLDRVISADAHPVGQIDGGADYDIWRTTANQVDWAVNNLVSGQLTLVHRHNGSLSGSMSGMERLIGADPGSAAPGTIVNRVSRSYQAAPAAPLGLHIAVFLTEASLTHAGTGSAIDLVNFNSFSGGLPGAGQPAWESGINVLATAYPMTISEFDQFIVGGNVNFGDTVQVNHVLTVRNVLEVIVSNASSLNEQTVFFGRTGPGRYRIAGLTPVAIHGLEAANDGVGTFPEITLLGSRTRANRFFVSAAASRTTITGGSANDTFVVGHAIGPDTRNLNWVTGVVNVLGGGGSDYLRVDDRDATGRFSYRIQDNWVYNAADPAGDAARSFAGVWHSGMSRVEVRGTAQDNVFRLTPSMTVRYSVFAGSPVDGLGDRLLLLGPIPLQRQFVSLGARRGTWFFGVNGNDDLFLKTVYIEDIETNASFP